MLYNETRKKDDAPMPKHLGLEAIGHATGVKGQNYLQKQFTPIDARFTYVRHKVYIGVNRKNEKISLKFNESHRLLVLGGSGYGKTWQTRAIIDRAYQSDVVPIILTDLKPEYSTSVFPALRDRQKFYFPEERAQGMPMKTYYPRCFLYIIGNFGEYLRRFEELGVHPVPISMSFDQMNITDFYSLLDKDLTDAQRDLLESLFNRKQDGQIRTLEQFILELKQNTKYDQKTAQTLMNMIENLVHIEALSDKYGFNVADDINCKVVPVMSLPGWLSLGRNRHYADAFVNLFAREILRGKMSGVIPASVKLLIVVDEARRFLGLSDIKDLIDTGRSYGISFLISSQSSLHIPPEVMQQCRFVFLPKGHDIDDANLVFKTKGIYPGEMVWHKTRVSKRMKALKRYKDGTREWLFMDGYVRKTEIVRTLSPLSRHLEEE